MSRVAVNGPRPTQSEITRFSSPMPRRKIDTSSAKLDVALVFRTIAVALVLFALPSVVLKAQEPEQWPQDDDDSAQQAQSEPSQAQPPGAFDYPQPNPEQGQQQAYGNPPQPGYDQPQPG